MGRQGDNRWLPAAWNSLCWPYGLTADADCAIITDSGNNRVLPWAWARDLELP